MTLPLQILIWKVGLCRDNWIWGTFVCFTHVFRREETWRDREQAEHFGGDVLHGILLPTTRALALIVSSGGARAVPLLGSRWCHCLCLRTCEVEEPFDKFVSSLLWGSQSQECYLVTYVRRKKGKLTNRYGDAFPCQACARQVEIWDLSLHINSMAFLLLHSCFSSHPLLLLLPAPQHLSS